MKQELERINKKLSNMDNSMTSMVKDQAHIRGDLNYHIKRTDLLEGFMKGLIKFLLAALLVIVGIGIKKVYSASINPKALYKMVRQIEKETNCRIVVTSAYRSKKHNKAVGGAPRSWHLVNGALDIVSTCKTPLEVGRLASMSFNTRIYKTHVHIDLDPRKTCAMKAKKGWKSCPFTL